MKALFLILMGLALISCSSTEKKSDTAEGAFELAQQYDKDELYEEAIRRYTDVKNKFPYSRYATQAELAISDVDYKKESYPEAQVSYTLFRELHPKHAQIDYVIFRIGMSYFLQLPDTVDRDLSLGEKAVATFTELIRNYPQSQYIKEATENKNKTIDMLVGKEVYIGDFYYQRQQYKSALPRFESALRKGASVQVLPSVLKKMALSYLALGEKEKSKTIYLRLNKDFASSTETAEVRKEIEK